MHLDIQVGEHAVDYNQIAQKEKLSELQLRLRQLLDQVEQITKEQNYQRVSVTLKPFFSNDYNFFSFFLYLFLRFLKKFLFYFQYREERFRQTSESTNSRVLWWSLTQTCILICMGTWQMKHLKSFFEAKKLV